MATKVPRKIRRLQSLLDAAGLHLALGDEDAALVALRRLSREEDCPAPVFEQLGMLLIKRGSVKDGAVFMRKGLPLNASAPQYGNLGYALMLAGETAEAKKILLRALERDSGFHPAHNTLALLFQQTGEYSLALEHFSHAIRLAPTTATTSATKPP